MLPRAHRLRHSKEFGQTVRFGVRAGSRTLVVYVANGAGQDPARVGFIVSKAVGGAVARNRVKRQLRAAVAAEAARLVLGSTVVVRALAPAADARFDELSAGVRSGLDRCARKAATGDPARTGPTVRRTSGAGR